MEFWFAAAAFVLLGAFAVWRDRRRYRRASLDDVGWIPWPAIVMASVLAAAICVAFALRTG